MAATEQLIRLAPPFFPLSQFGFGLGIVSRARFSAAR